MSEIFIDYYRDVEFNEVNKKADGDMLLFQYGIYDWEGEQYFQINFTRQFYEVYEDGHQIYQLEVTFYYLSDDLSDVLSFNKWSSECFDLDEFQDVIVKSVGFEKAINKISIRKEVGIDLIVPCRFNSP